MRITEISPRRQGLCVLTADGEEFVLNLETVAAHRLEKGATVERALLLRLVTESEYDRAKSRALWYLSRADHSEKPCGKNFVAPFLPKRRNTPFAE